MQIYFCGSIRGGREDRARYQRIIQLLRRYGTVLTEHVGAEHISDQGGDAFIGGDKFIHDRDLKWLNQADVVVAEVTQPSLGVGYELGHAVAMKKMVLCLFCSTSGRVLSAMVRGAENGEHFFVRDYQEEEEIEKVLQEYFTSRFPSLLHYPQVSASV
ncbi:5-hydroxymethyl-dUMP N-hydrolase [Microcaecilia unicolor]|uniref:2'-deoxynucleoside 5'-phosphate N-hydrolase 1 n=1 Tax=Microcaecilia unicolor TaxID=1415580 RepID=A0A6P7XGF9_9AMPH|nr:2'-deoxynucleoside 5'-phosphate N-hydrolase 1 [Microcaecilia unicolor]